MNGTGHLLADLLIFSVAAKRSETSRAPNLDEVDAVFDALAHAARRQLIVLLSYLGPELPSGYLARRFSHSWPTTTRHLNILHRAGVLEVRREGRASYYRLNRPLLERVVGGWLQSLTPPTPAQNWASSGPKFSHGLHTQPRSTKGFAKPT